MNWLFYVLLIFVVICMILGARKGFFRTAVSMVFMILVLFITSWINPYVGKFLRESTPVYTIIQKQCDKVISSQLEGTDKNKEKNANGNDEENTVNLKAQEKIPVSMQVELIEKAPIPSALKKSLLENNNSEIYQALGVEKFSDYIAGYLAYSITNGIGFLISFVLATIIMKVILHAIDILTSLPGINLINAVGGLLLGGVQGILWIWVFFIILTVLCNTEIGKVLMQAVEGNFALSYLYDKNVLLQVIMAVVTGK